MKKIIHTSVFAISVLGLTVALITKNDLSSLKSEFQNNRVENEYVSTYSSLNVTETDPGNGYYVEGSHQYFMGLTETGDLYAWGSNDHGEFGNNEASTDIVAQKDAIEIYDHTNGWLFLADPAMYNYSTGARLDGGIKDVSLGNHHSVVLMNNGSVWGWGYNMNIRLGIGGTEDTYEDLNSDIVSPTLIFDGVEPDDDEFVEDFNLMLANSEKPENDYSWGDTNLLPDYYGLIIPEEIKTAALADDPHYKNKPIGFWEVSLNYYKYLQLSSYSEDYDSKTNIVNHRNEIRGDVVEIDTEVDSTILTFEDGSTFVTDSVFNDDTHYSVISENEGYHAMNMLPYFSSDSFIFDPETVTTDGIFSFDIDASYGKYVIETSDITLEVSELDNPSNKQTIKTQFLYLNEDGTKHYETTTPLADTNEAYHIDSFTFSGWDTDERNEGQYNKWISTYDITDENGIIGSQDETIELNTDNPYDIINVDPSSSIMTLGVNVIDFHNFKPEDLKFELTDDSNITSNYFSTYEGIDPNDSSRYIYKIYGLNPSTTYNNLIIYSFNSVGDYVVIYDDDAAENQFNVSYELNYETYIPAFLYVILIVVFLIVIFSLVYMHLKLKKNKKFNEAKTEVINIKEM